MALLSRVVVAVVSVVWRYKFAPYWVNRYTLVYYETKSDQA